MNQLHERKGKNIPESMDSLLIKWQARGHNEAQMLTYLTKKYFNIQRLPLFEDRCLSLIDINNSFFDFLNKNQNKNKEILDINVEIINNVLHELEEDFDLLYKDTQKRLEEQFKEEFEEQEKRGEERHILLSRRICRKNDLEHHAGEERHLIISDIYNCEPHPLAIYNYINKQKLENKNIDIQMDILTSWAQNTADTYGLIKFEKKIHPKDIIFFTHHDDSSGPIESNEYIVVNKNITGIISFSADDIIVEKETFEKIFTKKEIDNYKNKELGLPPLRTYKIIQYLPYILYFNIDKKPISLLKFLYQSYLFYKKYNR